MKTKEVEKLVGISSTNLRFYEREHLLEPQRNKENNYREYSEEDIERLKQIKMLRMIGVPIPEIQELLAGGTSLRPAIEKRLEEINQEEAELSATRKVCENILNCNIEMEMLNTELFSKNKEVWENKLEDMLCKDKAEKLRWMTSILLSIIVILFSFAPLSWGMETDTFFEQFTSLYNYDPVMSAIRCPLVVQVLIPTIYLIYIVELVVNKKIVRETDYFAIVGRISTIFLAYNFVFTPWMIIRLAFIELEAININSGAEFWEIMVKEKMKKQRKDRFRVPVIR